MKFWHRTSLVLFGVAVICLVMVVFDFAGQATNTATVDSVTKLLAALGMVFSLTSALIGAVCDAHDSIIKEIRNSYPPSGDG